MSSKRDFVIFGFIFQDWENYRIAAGLDHTFLIRNPHMIIMEGSDFGFHDWISTICAGYCFIVSWVLLGLDSPI